MPDDQITFRTDPRIKERIAGLVQEKRYPSLSEFVNQAILLKFQVEQIAVDGISSGPDPMIAYFESSRGRALLREILREAREE